VEFDAALTEHVRADCDRAAERIYEPSRAAHLPAPYFVAKIVNAREREAQRSFVAETPVAHLLMYPADHDLGPQHKARRDRFHAAFPPKVAYELTDLGQELAIPVRAMGEWAVRNRRRAHSPRAVLSGRGDAPHGP